MGHRRYIVGVLSGSRSAECETSGRKEWERSGRKEWERSGRTEWENGVGEGNCSFTIPLNSGLSGILCMWS